MHGIGKHIAPHYQRTNLATFQKSEEPLEVSIFFGADIFHISFLVPTPLLRNPPVNTVLHYQQNAYVERFNRTVRYEWLSQHYWQSIDEVQMFATQWMYKYNHQRPNMALGGFTPKQRLAMAA